MRKQHLGEVRQDGLLYIDREKAVRDNIEDLKKMIRPGNVKPKPEGSPGNRPVNRPPPK